MSIELLEENCIQKHLILKPSKKVRFYVDTEKYIEDDAYHIYLQQEPEAIHRARDYLIENATRYTTILTFDKDVLQSCSNAIRFTFYTETWLQEKDYMNIDTARKKFQISTLVGGKRLTEGHEIRLLFYFHQLALQSLPITFFRSCAPPLLPEIQNNPFLESKEINAKVALFSDFQFHLAIENSRQENYFTEKLIDCLVSKTIPIYYGCPNIEEYFDTDGWIILEKGTPNELLEKCSCLHSEYYRQYERTIEANYKKALYFKENFQRLNEVLAKLPGYL
jgi:hypothetical protein